MSAAPYDIIQFFESDDLELHEISSAEGPWVPVQEKYRQLDATALVLLFQHGVRRIAVKHEERVVEFSLEEVILRDGSPLTTVERATVERNFIDVKRSVFRPDHWLAHCSCGWESDLKVRKVEAEMDGDEHLELTHGA